MDYRVYRVVLSNGKNVRIREKTTIPRQFSLIGEYEEAGEYDLISLRETDGPRILVPKRNIVCIVEI